MVERAHQTDVPTEEHSVAEHVTTHVTDADGGEEQAQQEPFEWFDIRFDLVAIGTVGKKRARDERTDEQQARAMVRRIVDARWQDGQLRDSGLTLAELELLVRAFVRVWRRMRHRRIPYPIPARKGYSA